MARDITRSDIRRMLERLEERADSAGGSPDGAPSTSNPGDKSREDSTPTASDHYALIMSGLSTVQLAKFVAIERNFDDTDPGGPDLPTPGTVNTEAFVPLSPYSRERAGGVSGPGDYLSDADAARLEVLTGGGERIDVTPEDMAAARRIEDEM